MGKLIHKDAVLATLFVFVSIWLLHLVVVNLHFFDPLEGALNDFDLTDIRYSRLGEEDGAKAHAIVDTNVVLVNIGDLDRRGIAGLLATINQQQPAVVGLDATFKQRKDPEGDSILKAAFAKTTNLVTANSFAYDSEEAEAPTELVGSNPWFDLEGKEGFSNFIVKDAEKTVRYYPPMMDSKGKTAEAFTTLILKKYAPKAFDALKARGHEAEMIHYMGKQENFITFDTDEVNDTNPQLRVMKGKIVLMGYLGDGLELSSIEDLHFTPFNHSYAGRSMPDMYGPVIHANILAMCLHQSYINTVGHFWVYLISVVLCFLHMYFFLHFYVMRHIWFHLAAKIVQLITSALIVLLALFLLGSYNIKLDSTVILVPIILSVDLLYFYDGLVKALNKYFNHKT
jgi:CHASE2 domain-containing sensor protein